MKKRNLKSLQLQKRVICSLKKEGVKGQFRRGSDNLDCSGDTAMIYLCHAETCSRPER